MIDFDSLDRMLTYAKAAPRLPMGTWVNECGTAGCLVGTFCLQEPEDALRIETPLNGTYGQPLLNRYPIEYAYIMPSVAERFGLTLNEAKWLFTCNPLFDLHIRKRPNAGGPTVNAQHMTKEQAIARLEKFLAYKKAKASLVSIQGRNGYIVDKGRHIAGISALSS